MIGQILDASLTTKRNKYLEYGERLGKLYTDHGFPIDMSLARTKASKEAKLVILTGACTWLVEHKRLSGATDKSIERQRSANKQMISSFISKGEVGVY